MSVAFAREVSAETAAEVELPDRPISPHPNWGTASGLEALTNASTAGRARYPYRRRRVRQSRAGATLARIATLP